MRERSLRRMTVVMALFISTALHAAGVGAVKVGDKAPDFALPATIGKQASNKDFANKTLVLFFYTGAFTNS